MKKLNTYIFLFLLSILQFTFVDAPRADFRVATVDVNKVLNESKEAQEKRKELDRKSSEAKKKIEERSKTLQADEKRLKESGEPENSKEIERFRVAAREFSRMVKDTEDELKRDFLKVNKVLTEKTLDIVSNYAKKNQIDLVLDKSEKGRGPVLYGSANFDITEDIVKEMNR